MELPETLFEEITGEASAPVYDATDERRKHPRVGFGSRARIFPLIENAGGRGCAVMMRDLSRGGVGFLFNHKLEIGDEFIILIPRQEGPSVQIQCMTQRCEPGGTGGISFVVGASFELVLDETSSPLNRPDAEGQTAGPTHWPGTVEEVARESFATSMYKCVSSIAMFDRSAMRIRNRLKSNAALAAEAKESADNTEIMTKTNQAAKTDAPATSETAPAAEAAVALPSYPIIEAPAPVDASRPHTSLFAAAGAEATIDVTATPVTDVPASTHVVTTVSTHVEMTVETTVDSVVESTIEMSMQMPAPVQVMAPVIEPVAVVETIASQMTGVMGAAAFAAIPVIATPVAPMQAKVQMPVQSPVIAPAAVVAAPKSPVARPSKPAAAAAPKSQSDVVLPWEMDAPAKKSDAAQGSSESQTPVAAAASNGDARESLSVFIAPLTCRRVRRRR